MKKISLEFQSKASINAEYTKLTLNEYISKPYKVVIECNITQTNVDKNNEFIKNTSTYLNEYVYIKVYQKYSNSTGSYRYISGKITNIVYKGISKKDDKNNIYLYEIVVQPPFVELMKNKKNKNYVNINIKNLIQEILDSNNISNYSLNDINESDLLKYSNTVPIHQNNETDYEFLMRVLLYYGINYYFIHIDKNSADKTTLKFISGRLPDVKFMHIDNDNKLINKLYLNQDSNDSSAGVFNNVLMEHIDKNFDIKDTNILLHGFEYGNDADSITQQNTDKAAIKTNIEDALSYKKNTIKLSSTYICAGINSKIHIKGYMPDENIEKDIYLIKSVTTVYDKLSDTKDNQDNTDVKDNMNIKDNIDIYGFFTDGINGNNGIIDEEIEKTAALYFDNNSSNVRVVANNISDNVLSNDKDFLIHAVVCDNDGNTDKNGIYIPYNNDKYNPSIFYALISGSDSKVAVNMVLPYGAKNHYLFSYPEIGSEVLLLYHNGKYYLYGYTPNLSQLMSNNGKMIDSSLFIGTPHNNYIHILNNVMIKNKIYDATIDSFMSEAYSYIDILSIKEDYENSKAAYNINGVSKTITIKEWCAQLKSEYEKNIQDKQYKIKNIENSNSFQKEIEQYDNNIKTIDEEITQAASEINTIFTKAKNSVKSIENFSDKDKELKILKINNYLIQNNVINIKTDSVDVNAYSTDIKALNRINLYSNNNGIEISSIDDAINIKANKSIKFMVGNNYIMINKNNIILSAQAKEHSLGPADSSITLDALTGTKISGATCSVNSMLSSSITDGFGGSLLIRAGCAQVSGIKAGINSFNSSSILALAKNISNIITTYCSESNSDRKSVAGFFTILESLKYGEQLNNMWKLYNANKSKVSKTKTIIDTAFIIMDIIINVLDGIAIMMEANKNYEQHVKNIRKAILSMKLILYTTLYLEIIVCIVIGDRYTLLSDGSISLIGGQIKCSSGKIEKVCLDSFEAITMDVAT